MTHKGGDRASSLLCALEEAQRSEKLSVCLVSVDSACLLPRCLDGKSFVLGTRCSGVADGAGKCSVLLLKSWYGGVTDTGLIGVIVSLPTATEVGLVVQTSSSFSGKR